MTRKHGSPDRRPFGNKAGQRGRKTPNPKATPPEHFSAEPLMPGGPEANGPVHPELEPLTQRSYDSALLTPTRSPERTALAEAPPSPARSRLEQIEAILYWLRIPTHWQLWGIASVFLLSGVAVLSGAMLFKLPALPNCPRIFWPAASASMRMYCAQLAAEDQQVESLLEAIELVNALPKDHPLRTESDRYIEIWSQQILDLADEAFQDGNLNQAVQAARRIPENTTARKLVDSQIKQWQAIWADAQKIYDDAEAALAQEDLREAFLIATRLLNIDNRYWGTAKYKELTEVITATRQDIEKLAKAREFSEKGGLENLVEAIRLAEQIRSESRVYQEAQKRIAAYGRGMLDLANNALERRDYDEAASIARQIPDVPTLKEEVRDFRTLADAQSVAWGGSVADLEIAINEAKKLQRGRPLYDRAQELIAYWQIEIEDVRRLDRARQLAQPGTPPALAAAIAEAQQIPPENPRGEEAQDEIKRWSETIQSAEDRPILDRAEQLARAGDINSLQAAIEEASRIGADRALSDEAGRLIQDWTARVQRMQDQPRLAQARALAARGDLVGAINVASQIDEGRVMYYEAQSDINEWQYRLEQSEDQPRLEAARRLASQGNLEDAIQVAGQIPAGRSLYGEAQGQIDDWRNAAVGEERLRQADRMAGIGTYPMLLSAIQTANSIAEDSPARSEADQLINQWSLDILQIAEERADINVSAAIAIAETIPSYTEAYEAAQLRIRAWRERLGN